MNNNFPVQQDGIRKWLLEGIKRGATHCLIIYDSFDYEDYPLYIMPGEDAREVAKTYEQPYPSLERLMEVYNLSMDIESQLNEFRAKNY